MALSRMSATAAAFAVLALTTSCTDASQPDDEPAISTSEESPSEAATEAPEDVRAIDDPEAIAEQLESALRTDPAMVVSEESDFTEGEAREGFPDGSEVEVLSETWSPLGEGRSGVVVIKATQSSGLAGSFAAVVQLEDDTWKIISTYELEEAP